MIHTPYTVAFPMCIWGLCSKKQSCVAQQPWRNLSSPTEKPPNNSLLPTSPAPQLSSICFLSQLPCVRHLLSMLEHTLFYIKSLLFRATFGNATYSQLSTNLKNARVWFIMRFPWKSPWCPSLGGTDPERDRSQSSRWPWTHMSFILLHYLTLDRSVDFSGPQEAITSIRVQHS